MRTLAQLVYSLDKPDTLRPALRTLGQRHVGYGVQAAHYDEVGAALLWTLEQGLGESFTPAAREAWAAAYGLAAEAMLEGASQTALS